jgi:MFS family permease
MIIAVASVAGPILGGLLTNLGWQFIFFMNVPIGIFGTIWSLISLKDLTKLPKGQSFDWRGTILFSIGMFLLLLGISFGGFIGWANLLILVSLVVGLVLLVAFFRTEGHVAQPMLDLRLFEFPRLAYAYIAGLLNSMARGAVMFLLVFYFEAILSFNPVLAGIYLTPFALAQVFMAPISGALADKYGGWRLAAIGLLISAAGLLGFVFISTTTPISLILLWQFIIGFGSGLFFSPNGKIIMESLPPQKRAIAAGVRSMLFNAGTVLSLGLGLAFLASTISPAAFEALFVGTQAGTQGIAVDEFIAALRLVFAISFGLSILASFLARTRGPEPRWDAEWTQSRELNPESIPPAEVAEGSAGKNANLSPSEFVDDSSGTQDEPESEKDPNHISKPI